MIEIELKSVFLDQSNGAIFTSQSNSNLLYWYKNKKLPFLVLVPSFERTSIGWLSSLRHLISGGGVDCAAHLRFVDSPSFISTSEEVLSSINLGGTDKDKNKNDEL